MSPNLIDKIQLDKEIKKIIIKKDIHNYNIIMFCLLLFIIFLIFILNKNTSKKKSKDNYIEKLKYILLKSDDLLNK